jgi:hypothetical protein
MAITKPRPRQVPDAGESFIAKAPDAKPARWQRGNKTQFTFSIAPELLERIDEIAHRKHLSRAALLTVWINDRLEQEGSK